MIIGIDASRNRSGGAKAHLVGILKDSNPLAHGIRKVHVWSYKRLLDALPDRPWLFKHNPPELEGSLLRQVAWQHRSLPQAARGIGCHILLNTDAGSVSTFRPAVVMSRDMLSYEPGEMQRYGFTKARLRLLLLRIIQSRSLQLADGAVFLTSYAAAVIQRATGPLPRLAIIPHGVGEAFRNVAPAAWPAAGQAPVECLYVSNAAPYKHQWHVVRAFSILREKGYQVRLTLVGGGSGPAQRRLDAEIRRSDPGGAFVRMAGFVDPERLPATLSRAHVFVFASSCENMPNTLLEAMAVGLPIACSNRGPMPEILGEAGSYFDPEQPESIAAAVERLLCDAAYRRAAAERARDLSATYSWSRCGNETWAFLRATMNAAGTGEQVNPIQTQEETA